MLTKAEFYNKIAGGLRFLDGATGSNLRAAGMPPGCQAELWVLEHPQVLLKLQQGYAEAGSQILYAPTFQATPIALEQAGLAHQTEKINAQLVRLTRSVSDRVLVAGNLTTMVAHGFGGDPSDFNLMVENYRRQIRGLVDGGADLLAAETLMNPMESEAILTAAELEGAGAVMYSFAVQPDGALYSGRDTAPLMQELEQLGAAAVGFNCVSASNLLPHLVTRLRQFVKGPLLCKPNAGDPQFRRNTMYYPMHPTEFAAVMAQCAAAGATLLGGCCGTDPDFIRETRIALEKTQ